MDEMGHTDPELALRVYRQAMRRGEDEKAQLQALVEGGMVAVGGRREAERTSSASTARPPERRNRRLAGGFWMGAAGFEPATSRV